MIALRHLIEVIAQGLAKIHQPSLAAAQQLPAELQQQLLAQLEDIQLPEKIGWWPPSWQQLSYLAAALCVVALVLFYSIRRQQALRYQRQALAELAELKQNLDKLNCETALQNINSILKRCCRHRGQNLRLSLYGEAWYQSLCADLNQSPAGDDCRTWQALSLNGTEMASNNAAIVQFILLAERWLKLKLKHQHTAPPGALQQQHIGGTR
ncbi:DUF4381 domain-containing protein [Agaribacterium haliotis]|uniref:DUF4381 domain-containing protein n=1 Tax=Agaribacterium haliotis TaxID=2013869 RepID=UPI000BB5864F|nr:DUF4381 domain-containing protein [Agaribacterium haliotis]